MIGAGNLKENDGEQMFQCNPKKCHAQLVRIFQKSEPWRRKQYRKARYRKQALRNKLCGDIDYAKMTMSEPWEWKFHEIWVL